jgi:Protein of unknown function (DUF3631)
MPRVRPHDAMRLVLRRLDVHKRNVEQIDGGSTWVAHCPDHTGRSGAVRFDQRNDGTVAVHPHRRDGQIVCEPASIIGALAISDERIKPYSNNGHGGLGTKADPFAKPARVRRNGEPAVDSHEIFERLKQALVDNDCTGPRGHPRYRCPACQAPGDGHGLRITHHPNASGTKRKILLICDANRCPVEEILEPLGMTLAEICAGDDVDDLGEDEPAQVTARTRSTPTITAGPSAPTENGADLLDDVRAFPRAYVVFPSDAAAVAVTLWAVHTHLVEAFESTPRLALLSPEKQSGKSRTLELLELLCAGAETLSDASASYLFRRIGAGAVTVLLDEADAVWKRGKTDETAEALRSIVNAGHRKGATVGRVEMKGQAANLVRFRVYAPVALAGIGNCLPDTILDRSVIVPMRRRAPDEQIEPYRERLARPEGDALRDRLTAWCATVTDKVGYPWPDMPSGVTDRPADVWEPLLAVADAAGGDWPELARAACVAFVTGAKDDVASIGTRLLTDLLAVFRDGADIVPALWTEHILAKLCANDEAPWGNWYSRRGQPLDARGLAGLLKPYKIKSGTVRIGNETAKGYRRDDLWDAWSRYGVLTSLSDTSVTSVTPLASTVTDVTDVTDNPPGTRAGEMSVCATCDQPMKVIEDGQTVHPNPMCEKRTP